MDGVFENKTILITGGTGFLGKALVREIMTHNPKSVRVFSRDEVKHHKFYEWFNKELKDYNHEEKIRHLIGDIRDYKRLKSAMRGADIVIHAAALKRIDILEYNVDESIKTNIIGSMNVVHAALTEHVGRVIFVSTDKACSPVNTYGACKFVSERIFVESNFSKGNRPTIFSCVRYGNVLESTGSVIPFFESKIRNGEPIPLTDPQMTRFFISPKQAVELIIDSIKHGVGGEIFVPKLPAFRITDLIQILKEKHNSNAAIKDIGLRPGEKIHELMINDEEIRRTFDYENRYIITSSILRYQPAISSIPYIDQNKMITHMKEYSSRDNLMSKEELIRIFSSFGLL